MVSVAVEVIFEDGALDAEGIRDAFRAMDEASRMETSCLRYTSSVDICDRTIVQIDELWDSMDALGGE